MRTSAKHWMHLRVLVVDQEMKPNPHVECWWILQQTVVRVRIRIPYDCSPFPSHAKLLAPRFRFCSLRTTPTVRTRHDAAWTSHALSTLGFL